MTISNLASSAPRTPAERRSMEAQRRDSSLQTAADHRDRSGFSVFSGGDVGAMHVLAHETFDHVEIARGHRVLGAWLDGRRGHGSEWIHLQFHMAVFELALGRWHAAHRRFLSQILPAASSTRLALTDGPALIWRLAITAPFPVELPWTALCRVAEQAIGTSRDPFVELHQLLVFAGAGDTSSLDAWLAQQHIEFRPAQTRVLRDMAIALRAIATQDYALAAMRLKPVVPRLGQIGGSFAQNGLFPQLADWCAQQPTGTGRQQGMLAAVA